MKGGFSAAGHRGPSEDRSDLARTLLTLLL